MFEIEEKHLHGRYEQWLTEEEKAQIPFEAVAPSMRLSTSVCE